MNLNDIQSQVALGEDSRRQFKRDVTNVDSLAAEMAAFANSEGGVIFLGVADDGELPNNLTVAKIRAGNSIIRNPILVSYIAKGLLPYRGLGSGIKRALEDWAEIDFVDDRDANLFTATVHRKELISSVEPETSSEKSTEKSSEKILALLKANPELSAREVAEAMGITSRAVEKQISKLRDEDRIRRIGPAKGGHWEVVE
jgi:ATP-dependent DNA helicase RecG